MTNVSHPTMNIGNITITEKVMEPVDLVFTKNNSITNKISDINHSSQNITTENNFCNENQSLPKFINEDITLTPCKIPLTNAKDYIFLGSCIMPLISDMGATLNHHGEIILIQGNSYNLISSLYQNKIKNYNYYSLKNNNNRDEIYFDLLYINESGQLTAKVKEKDIYYTIEFNAHTDINTIEETKKKINVTYTKKIYPLKPMLSFHTESGNITNFNFKNNDLYLSDYSIGNKNYHYELMNYKINTPFSKTHRINSVKRCRNMLQIEVMKNNKATVFYINPKDISISQLKAKKLTYAPPQDIYTFLGGDIHDKYHCGQPFSPSQLSTLRVSLKSFFTKIPSSIKTEFKLNNIKKNKESLARIKRLDPGISTAISVIKDLSKKPGKKIISNQIFSEKIIHDLHNNFSPLIHKIPAWILEEKTFTKKISSLLTYLDTNDAIVLSKESEFSIFFSLLQGGMPFYPGWFLGMIFSIAKTQCLTLSKTETGNIKLTFIYKKKTSSSILGGTGQGLESKILGHNFMKFLSVMPFEANIILSINKSQEIIFSFELTKKQFESFISQENNFHCQDDTYDKNIKSAHFKHMKEYSTSLSLDMKISELRAMSGVDTMENVRFQLPRLACGAGLNTSIISFSNKKITRSSDTNKSVISEGEKKFRFLSTSENIFSGIKHILSPYSISDTGEISYRLALIENGNKKDIHKKRGFTYTHYKNKTAGKIVPTRLKYNLNKINKINQMLSTITEDEEIIRPMNKITHLKLTRNSHEKINFLNDGLLDKILPSRPHQKLINTFETHERRQQFIDSMNTIAVQQSNKKRKSTNKKLQHDLVAKYHIDINDKMRLQALKQELVSLENSYTELTKSQEKKKLIDLQQRIEKFKNDAMYQLNTIDLYSTGALTQTKASLTNVILNFRQSNILALKKHLGRISVEYADTPIPTKISGNYRFF